MSPELLGYLSTSSTAYRVDSNTLLLLTAVSNKRQPGTGGKTTPGEESRAKTQASWDGGRSVKGQRVLFDADDAGRWSGGSDVDPDSQERMWSS